LENVLKSLANVTGTETVPNYQSQHWKEDAAELENFILKKKQLTDK